MDMLWSWHRGVRGQVDRVRWSRRWKRKEGRSYHETHYITNVIHHFRFSNSHCHGTTSFPLLCLPLPTSACLRLCPPTSIDICLPSATTPKCTCSILTQLHCACCWTNFGSRPNTS